MGTITLRPNFVNVAGGQHSFVGGTTSAVLGDDSDASYMTIASTIYGDRVQVGFPTPALPAGATIKRLTPRVRVSNVAGASRPRIQHRYKKSGGQWITSALVILQTSSTIRTLTAPSSPSLNPADTAAAVADLEIYLLSPSTSIRFYDVYLDVLYDEAPLASNLATTPAGAEGLTTRPGLTWSYSDPETSAQQAYWVEVWDVADINAIAATSGINFDTHALPDRTGTPDVGPFAYQGYTGAPYQPVAATREPVGASVIPSNAAPTSYASRKISAPVLGSTTTWFPDVDLPNNRTYRAFVWVADDGAGTGTRFGDRTKVATLDFTTAVPLPPSPQAGSITVTRDATKFVNKLTVQANNNILTANQSDLSSDLSGWEINANATIARTTNLGSNGINALQITVTTAGFGSARTLSANGARLATTNSGNWTFMASVRSAAVSRSASLVVRWWDAANARVGADVTVGTVTTSTTAWTQISGTVAKPAGAVTCAVVITVNTVTGTNEVHYADAIGAFPGTVSTWSRGGLTDEQYALVERSLDGGTTWSRFLIPGQGATPDYGRNALRLLVATQSATTYDTTLPPNASVRYRFSVMAQDLGYLVTSVTSTATTALSSPVTKFLLRDPDDPVGDSFVVQISGDLGSTSTERQGSFSPLGREFPVILSDALGGEVWQVVFQTKSPAEYAEFEALRAKQKTLLFQDDMGGQYWVRIGPDRQATLRNSVSRKTNQYREINITLTEVDPPIGAEQ